MCSFLYALKTLAKSTITALNVGKGFQLKVNDAYKKACIELEPKFTGGTDDR